MSIRYIDLPPQEHRQPLAPAMSLRDWFAGQAIIGLIANPDISASAARLHTPPMDFRTDIARTAFEMADLLLAERSKP